MSRSLQLISIMFVGHLGELPLSVASMATSFASVTGFSLAVIILLVVSIPLAFIWANSRYLLEAVGQDHQIAIEAGHYAQLLIPGLFAYGLLYSLLRFLQAQNIVFPMMITTAITTLLHLPLCWILVFKFGLGHPGAALATGVSYWVNAILLALYVKFSSLCSKTWTGFFIEAFHDLFTVIKLSIPSACMTFNEGNIVLMLLFFPFFSYSLEMWSFEMMVLLGGLLPNPTLETSVLSITS
ncbi:Protein DETOXIFICATION 17, partial [Bienertia sinuspersici]